MDLPIPVIDIFAGPGGLGEGFSTLQSEGGDSIFKIMLSIEKDELAHNTLELRAFYRQFPAGQVPDSYYQYLRGEIKREELFRKHPTEYVNAKKEAWLAELGKTDQGLVRSRIIEALNGASNWILIGGPPCQAYSLVGRSRMRGENPWKYAKDHRHHLYKQYLQILADHQPPVFVMENVKGLLSSSRTKTNKQNTFDLIINDLKRPLKAKRKGTRQPLSYHLFSCSTERTNDKLETKDFVVRSEEYGVPQARHRIIILGIRSDVYKSTPGTLTKAGKQIPVESVIGDLPRLRSGLSKEEDDSEEWFKAIKQIETAKWLETISSNLRQAMITALRKTDAKLNRGYAFTPFIATPKEYYDWYVDEKLGGLCNHETRAHIREDLHRYFFAAVYAKLEGRSPTLNNFPKKLLPRHENVQEALNGSKFNDRFRVQLRGRPSTTVVSHISKDGHYYIHYDPSQCRSLTVREAARLQTFPDNYFFEGNRTQQYHQVGNAVPPMLAYKIAEIVYRILNNCK